MSTHIFRCPPRLLSGPGCLADAGRQASAIGCRHALIVTAPQVEQAGHVARLAASLAAAGVATTVFAAVDAEPTTAHVEAGHRAYVAAGADGVVSIGGGSCLDAGKGVAVRARNTGPMSLYEGYDRISGGSVPHLAISTTAGTGSEVTRFAVFTDTERDVKMLVASDAFIPNVAIEDAELTLSCPPAVTAAAGIDALTHAIEAYVSRHANALTDAIALSAIRLVSGALLRAYEQGDDLAARTSMLDASLQAGLAFSNASVALVHGMARPLGAVFHIPHGAANGILLPHIMAFSLPSAVARYAAIGEALGTAPPGTDQNQVAAQAVEGVRTLCRRLGLGGLGGFGVTPQQLAVAAPKMAADAL
ncbi:MAG TPA: iron-containing alcohol dehydrogenase, partial [Chloroflexota bacterium]|nr:iron-containing alcohol dehydrogenase [Chloroflexota bacterium]